MSIENSRYIVFIEDKINNTKDSIVALNVELDCYESASPNLKTAMRDGGFAKEDAKRFIAAYEEALCFYENLKKTIGEKDAMAAYNKFPDAVVVGEDGQIKEFIKE